jgi:hypothetical protein
LGQKQFIHYGREERDWIKGVVSAQNEVRVGAISI